MGLTQSRKQTVALSFISRAPYYHPSPGNLVLNSHSLLCRLSMKLEPPQTMVPTSKHKTSSFRYNHDPIHGNLPKSLEPPTTLEQSANPSNITQKNKRIHNHRAPNQRRRASSV